MSSVDCTQESVVSGEVQQEGHLEHAIGCTQDDEHDVSASLQAEISAPAVRDATTRPALNRNAQPEYLSTRAAKRRKPSPVSQRIARGPGFVFDPGVHLN